MSVNGLRVMFLTSVLLLEKHVYVIFLFDNLCFTEYFDNEILRIRGRGVIVRGLVRKILIWGRGC